MSNVLKFKTKKAPDPDLSPAELKVWCILESTVTSATRLAELYGVSSQTVRNVKLLKTARAEKIAGLMKTRGVEATTWEPAKRFTDAQAEAIRTDSRSSKKLGEVFGVSPSTIRMIKTGKTYVS